MIAENIGALFAAFFAGAAEIFGPILPEAGELVGAIIDAVLSLWVLVGGFVGF